VQVNPGETPTFSFFATAGGPIPFDPAVNRIVVSARDGAPRSGAAPAWR
jgi:hypothetical protein